MGLRLLLVSLVAGLGLELPTRQDLERWAHSGQIWLCSTLDEWNAWEPASDEMFCVAAAPMPPAPVPAACAATAAEPAQPQSMPTETTSDSEFAAVVDDMVNRFAADLPATAGATAKTLLAEQPAAPTATPSAPAFEPLDAPADLYPGVAYALNREAEGVAPPAQEPADVTGPVLPVEPAPEPASLAEAETETQTATSATVQPPDLVPANEPKPVGHPVGQHLALLAPGRQRLAAAIRLTGEALEAWASLLEGPAVVSIRP